MCNMCKTIQVRSLAEIHEAVTLVLEETQQVCGTLQEEESFQIKLILNELLANSLAHSHPAYARVLFRMRDNMLECCVLDPGDGFPGAQQAVRQPCPGVFSECGRGIFLVKTFADWIRYNRRGNVVLFGYRL